MEIAELGEFGLIKHLTKEMTLVNSSTLKSVGDDCAVIALNDEEVTLVTTDMLMEGVHFDLTYMPLRHLGYKSVMVNLSDIYAMNGTPKQITVSLAISKRFKVEDIEDLYSGMRLACEQHGVDIVGGDTTSSLTGLAISITAIGVGKKDEVAYRSGANETDLICVSGNLGAAYMGLQILEREKAVYNQQVIEAQQQAQRTGGSVDEAIAQIPQPDFMGKEYLLERQMKPEARKDIIERLHNAGVKITSMIDISDGLSSELMHICTQSNVGCSIYEDKLPIDYQAAALAEEMNLNIVTCALNGGEDYELLFTCSLDDYEKLIPLEDVYLIGHITKPELGTNLIGRNGEELSLQAQGWNAFKK